MVGGILSHTLVLLLGVVVTLLADAVREQLRAKARRSDLIFEKRVDRLFQVEELAGHLTEFLGSYRSLNTELENLHDEYRQIERMNGSFRRYPEVTQAVRRFRNRAGRILSEGGRTEILDREEQDEAVEELDEAFDALTDAIDEVLDRHGIYDLRE